MNPVWQPAHAVWREYRKYPNPTANAVFAGAAGLIAIWRGEGASRAFTIIGGGDTIPVLLGCFLALGGVLTLLGACKYGLLMELIGASLVAGGASIYAAGVIGGLQWEGSIAALGYAAIAAGMFGRVFLIAGDARKLAQRDAP